MQKFTVDVRITFSADTMADAERAAQTWADELGYLYKLAKQDLAIIRGTIQAATEETK